MGTYGNVLLNNRENKVIMSLLDRNVKNQCF